jgi:hypothetical protein
MRGYSGVVEGGGAWRKKGGMVFARVCFGWGRSGFRLSGRGGCGIIASGETPDIGRSEEGVVPAVTLFFEED